MLRSCALSDSIETVKVTVQAGACTRQPIRYDFRTVRRRLQALNPGLLSVTVGTSSKGSEGVRPPSGGESQVIGFPVLVNVVTLRGTGHLLQSIENRPPGCLPR